MALDLEALYTDLHAHPELSFQEVRTAGVIADTLTELGIAHETGIGTTGVVATVSRGDGPVVWLRADTDALPVEEQTGLPYASTARGVDPDGVDVPVMHACGHDMHITALLGALEALQADQSWTGTVVALFQPAEEYGAGALAMLDDGLLDRFPQPDIVLGQHLTPLPAGQISVRPGTQMSATDGLTVTLFGRGGHGSRPHTTVDPIVMAAATVMRLQTVVSRGVDPREMAVVTVGSLHAGLKNNIIPAQARLDLSLRYTNDEVRNQVLSQVERVVKAEAAASGADIEPTIETLHRLPATINDEAAVERLSRAWTTALGEGVVTDTGFSSGSEDVSWFATRAGVPLVYWFWGGLDADSYADAAARGVLDSEVPSNHSPFFAPILQPTIDSGVSNLVIAAKEFLQC